MQGVQGFGNIDLGNNGRNITFGRALRNGNNIYTVLTQRTEHAPTGTRTMLHSITYHGDDRQIIFDWYIVYFLVSDFILKLLFNRSFCFRGIVMLDRKTNRMFRRGLAYQDHIYVLPCERSKQAHRRADNAQQAATLEA